MLVAYFSVYSTSREAHNFKRFKFSLQRKNHQASVSKYCTKKNNLWTELITTLGYSSTKYIHNYTCILDMADVSPGLEMATLFSKYTKGKSWHSSLSLL